jgi:hypothetical protein
MFPELSSLSICSLNQHHHQANIGQLAALVEPLDVREDHPTALLAPSKHLNVP